MRLRIRRSHSDTSGPQIQQKPDACIEDDVGRSGSDRNVNPGDAAERARRKQPAGPLQLAMSFGVETGSGGGDESGPSAEPSGGDGYNELASSTEPAGRDGHQKLVPSANPNGTEGGYRLLFRFHLFQNGWGLYPDVRFVSPEGAVGHEAPGAFTKNLARARTSPRETNALGFMRHGHSAGIPGFKKPYGFADRAPAGYVFRQLRDVGLYTHSSFRSRLERHPERLSFRLNVLAQDENAYGLHLVLADPRGVEITVDASTRVLTVDAGTAYVYADRVLYEAMNCPPAPLLDVFLNGELPSGLPFGAVMKWLEKLPPGLAEGVARDLSGAVEPELIREFRGCRLRLSETADRLDARCLFVYGDDEHEVPAHPAVRTKLLSKNGALYRIERDPKLEASYMKALSNVRLQALGDILRLSAEADPIRFLLRDLARLEEQGIAVSGVESLTQFKVRRAKPKVSVAVQSDIDWFDVNVVLDYNGIHAHLKEILNAIHEDAEYISLPDGSIAPFDKSLRQALGFLVETGRQGPRADSIRLNQTQVLAAEDILALADERNANEAFETSLARLRSFQGLERTEPAAGFQAQLRTYQQAGLDWLHFLRTYGFGGILADDMGLGKTIQMLALLHLQKSGRLRSNGSRRTHLIVAPTSLVYNWQREAERFTPDLDVLDYTGSGRARDLRVLRRNDLVLTSYAILRRDAEFLAEAGFDTVVLDESHHIKNPHSQTFKAAMSLGGKHRVCLTGTPVENSTIELWSQMHFANPGGLGSLNGFKDRFVTPIEKYGDRATADRLRRLTHPFILRRRKDEVADDLPPKVEQVVYCEMEGGQRRIYEKWRDYYRAGVLDAIQAEGLQKSRMKVLEGLMKLRQISNHPRLVEPAFEGASGKFEVLMDTLDELRDEGHKVLVFSQFVKMLDVIRCALDGRGVRYAYLDGRTRGRQAVVDAFQEDPDIPHFLISLRAGGVGLNVTAADYALIVDPWWNPAVDEQAIDRTHRIGQNRTVFAQKLITRGTVEEKILDLQERKKQLAEDVIAADENVLKALSLEDIEAFFSEGVC